MDIIGVQQCFEEIAKYEIGTDGYVEIKNMFMLPTLYTTVVGCVGKRKPDGEKDWSRDFELKFKNGKTYEFLRGMFYKTLYDIFEE